MNHAQIADKLGQTRDSTRKQIKEIERLWAEKTREIHKLAAKLNLIASAPRHDTGPQ
jgi:hypothetical protein